MADVQQLVSTNILNPSQSSAFTGFNCGWHDVIQVAISWSRADALIWTATFTPSEGFTGDGAKIPFAITFSNAIPALAYLQAPYDQYVVTFHSSAAPAAGTLSISVFGLPDNQSINAHRAGLVANNNPGVVINAGLNRVDTFAIQAAGLYYVLFQSGSVNSDWSLLYKDSVSDTRLAGAMYTAGGNTQQSFAVGLKPGIWVFTVSNFAAVNSAYFYSIVGI